MDVAESYDMSALLCGGSDNKLENYQINLGICIKKCPNRIDDVGNYINCLNNEIYKKRKAKKLPKKEFLIIENLIKSIERI